MNHTVDTFKWLTRSVQYHPKYSRFAFIFHDSQTSFQVICFNQTQMSKLAFLQTSLRFPNCLHTSFPIKNHSRHQIYELIKINKTFGCWNFQAWISFQKVKIYSNFWLFVKMFCCKQNLLNCAQYQFLTLRVNFLYFLQMW